MNFFVTTNDAPEPDMVKCFRVGRLLLLAIAISLLAACAQLPKRTPPPKPTITTTPTPKPPVTVPVQPPAGFVLVAPANHELEKKRIKSQLSKNPRDSLPVSEVGYYMDVLQGRVKQRIGKTKGVGMARNDDLIVIVMRGDAGFEVGNSQVSLGIRQFLAPLSKVLVDYRMTLVSIRVRNDDVGSGNQLLTEQRSLAVARYLMEAGVSSKRMIVVGAGKNGTTPTNPGSAGRERIELQIEPLVRLADE